MGRTLARLILVAAWLPATAEAQIVAPGGRTLFNRAVMFRSFVRIDNFDEGVPGLRVRRVVNPYAVVWGAYPHLSLSFVAPLVSLQSEGPNLPARDFTTTSFADSAVFARYDLLRKVVPGGYTRLSPEIGLKAPSGGPSAPARLTPSARSSFPIFAIPTG